MKELDRRGYINTKIYRYMTLLNLDDLEESARDMELKYEVQEASVREIKSEHEGGE